MPCDVGSDSESRSARASTGLGRQVGRWQPGLENDSNPEAWRERNDKDRRWLCAKVEGNETESSLSALILFVVVKSNLGFLKDDANDVCFDIMCSLTESQLWTQFTDAHCGRLQTNLISHNLV